MISHSATRRLVKLQLVKTIELPKKHQESRVYFAGNSGLEHSISLPKEVARTLKPDVKYSAYVERILSGDFVNDDPLTQRICTTYEEIVTLCNDKGLVIYKVTPQVVQDCISLLEQAFSPKEKKTLECLGNPNIKENLHLGLRTRGILRLWNNNCRSAYFKQLGIQDVMNMSDYVLMAYRDYLRKK